MASVWFQPGLLLAVIHMRLLSHLLQDLNQLNLVAQQYTEDFLCLRIFSLQRNIGKLQPLVYTSSKANTKENSRHSYIFTIDPQSSV
jgi:hypothetical protein